MSIHRLFLSWSAALLCIAASPALAESGSGATCEESAQAAPGGSEESLMCNAMFCSDDWECQAACPTAQTAACIDSVCEYTYRTGGGGGGGPLCNARFCSDDWDCECNGQYGYCGADSTCHF